MKKSARPGADAVRRGVRQGDAQVTAGDRRARLSRRRPRLAAAFGAGRGSAGRPRGAGPDGPVADRQHEQRHKAGPGGRRGRKKERSTAGAGGARRTERSNCSRPEGTSRPAAQDAREPGSRCVDPHSNRTPIAVARCGCGGRSRRSASRRRATGSASPTATTRSRTARDAKYLRASRSRRSFMTQPERTPAAMIARRLRVSARRPSGSRRAGRRRAKLNPIEQAHLRSESRVGCETGRPSR